VKSRIFEKKISFRLNNVAWAQTIKLKRNNFPGNLKRKDQIATLYPRGAPGKFTKQFMPIYGEHFGQLAEDIIKAVLAISPSIIDRILKPVRIQYQKRGKSTTKPGTLLRKPISINTNQWEVFRPGYLKADTVTHLR